MLEQKASRKAITGLGNEVFADLVKHAKFHR